MLPEEDVYRGIIFPRKPAFHEIAAPVLVERRYGRELPIVREWNLPSCPVEQLEEWDEQGLISINLGPERHDLGANGFSSAAEFVAVSYGLELTGGEKRLLEMLGKHNTDPRNRGYLNKFHMSVSWMSRELMEFPMYDDQDHLRRVMNVIHVWLRYKDREDRSPILGRTTETLKENWQHLAAETKALQGDPFSAGQYLSNRWLLGDPAEDILGSVSYWVTGWRYLRSALENAKEEFAELPKNWFAAGELKGLAISTPSKFISKQAVRHCEVLVVQNPENGHTAILTNGLDLAELADFLKERESGLWHSTGGWLVNGGASYDGVEATSFSLRELVRLVRQFPPRRQEKTLSKEEKEVVRRVLR